MSIAASRLETEFSTYVDSSGGVQVADVDSSPYPSPARRLQDQLEARLTRSPEPEPARWPGFLRVAMIGGSSLTLWIGLICAAFATAKHVLH